MPTVREYLTNCRGQAKASTEKNRQRAIKYFLEYLGKGADVRLDALSRQTVIDFLPWALERVAVGTVKLYRAMLATAFNAAVDDELIPRSPMPRIVKMDRMAETVNPEIKRDVVKRQPFTPDELSRIFYTFPLPWADMALASFALGGLRLGEVCCLRWENVDLRRDVVTVETTKTEKTLEQALPPLLKARLLARREMVEEAEPYIFPNMARRYQREDSSISSEFSALLRASGIVRAMPETALKGNRKKVNPLLFHSLRHSFCTLGRCDSGVVPDFPSDFLSHSSLPPGSCFVLAPRVLTLTGQTLSCLANQPHGCRLLCSTSLGFRIIAASCGLSLQCTYCVGRTNEGRGAVAPLPSWESS